MEAQENNTNDSGGMMDTQPRHDYILPREYLSASAIGTLLKCGKQYEFRYIKNVTSKTTLPQFTGKTVHKANELYYSDKIKNTFSVLNGTQMADLAVDILDQELLEAELDEPINRETLIPNIRNITKDYVDNIGVITTPKVVEQEVRYISRCGVEILAYIDLIRFKNEFEAAIEDQEIIADYKITGKKWSLANLLSSLQFNVYALATGIPVVEIQNVVNNAKKGIVRDTKPESFISPEQDLTSNIRLLRHRFPKENQNHIEHIIESAAKLITSGIFIPTDPGNWWCSERFCAYYHLCRSGTCI